jgi:hypothetical protein
VPELEPPVSPDVLGQVVRIPCIGERVENDDVVIGTLAIQISDKVAPDESRATGNQNCFHAEVSKIE